MACSFDALAIQIADDVLCCVKKSQDNLKKVMFSLPENIHDNIIYECDYIVLDCVLTINRNKILRRPYLIDDAYLTGDDNINIDIFLNPAKESKYYNNLYFELIETIRHEIQHARQYAEPDLPTPHGKKGKYKEPKGIKYYLMPDELDAQIAGFQLQSKQTGKSFNSLVRKYYINRLDLLPITKSDVKILVESLNKYGKIIGAL